MSLKDLARVVLERNQQGNLKETGWQNQRNYSVDYQVKKFPEKIQYVACINCNNLDNGYCSVWKHYPDVPQYDCRICKDFESKSQILGHRE